MGRVEKIEFSLVLAEALSVDESTAVNVTSSVVVSDKRRPAFWVRYFDEVWEPGNITEPKTTKTLNNNFLVKLNARMLL